MRRASCRSTTAAGCCCAPGTTAPTRTCSTSILTRRPARSISTCPAALPPDPTDAAYFAAWLDRVIADAGSRTDYRPRASAKRRSIICAGAGTSSDSRASAAARPAPSARLAADPGSMHAEVLVEQREVGAQPGAIRPSLVAEAQECGGCGAGHAQALSGSRPSSPIALRTALAMSRSEPASRPSSSTQTPSRTDDRPALQRRTPSFGSRRSASRRSPA